MRFEACGDSVPVGAFARFSRCSSTARSAAYLPVSAFLRASRTATPAYPPGVSGVTESVSSWSTSVRAS